MLACLNQITLGRTPPPSLGGVARDLGAMHEAGWPAVELWLRHWDALIAADGMAAARRALDDSGLVVAGGCAQPGLLFSKGDELQRYRDELRLRLEQCQALGAPHLVVTAGPAQSQDPLTADNLKEAAANLRMASDLASDYGVRLGIEFLKGVRLVNNLSTALHLAELVGRENVGVLLDPFHFYAGLSKMEDLEGVVAQPGRLFFVHVNDVPASPRELWADADRVLPGTGCVPLGAIFDSLARSGYGGYVSLELFSSAFAARWSDDPRAAARDALDSVAKYLSRYIV